MGLHYKLGCQHHSSRAALLQGCSVFLYGVKEVKGRHYVLLPLAAVICHRNFFNTLPLRGVLEKVPAENFRSVCMECHHFNAARNGLQNGGTTDVRASSKN